jgi:hypothetical protein
MTPEEFNTLRREVKMLIVGLDLDLRRGERPLMLAELSKRLGKELNSHSLSMALTGYRNGAAYGEILRTLKDILTDCDFIHKIENQHN